jgi:hypothetical protein
MKGSMAGRMEVGKGEAAKLWRGEKRYEDRRRKIESENEVVQQTR